MKTRVLCETSSKFHATSFQNDCFARDFSQFSRNKLVKRVFRATLPPVLTWHFEAENWLFSASFLIKLFWGYFVQRLFKQLANFYPCHAKLKRNLNACQKAQQKHAICEEIDLKHVILITLWERRPMARPSELRSRCGCACNAGRARLPTPDLQS